MQVKVDTNSPECQGHKWVDVKLGQGKVPVGWVFESDLEG